MKWNLPTYARIRPSLSDSEPLLQYNIKSALKYGYQTQKETASILELTPSEFSQRALLFTAESLSFPFNKVFESESSQEDVYAATAADAVHGAFDGYNGTIFAYGQTRSGKTFTMTGGDDFASRGLIPRVITAVFKEVSKRQKIRVHESQGAQTLETAGSFTVQVTYMQIYNEVLYDLLDISHQNLPLDQWTKVQILDDEEGLQHLRNLRVYEVSSEVDALNLLFLGQVNRATAATSMNDVSSRSHCIFTVHVSSEGFDASGAKVRRNGKIHLVDLAGSERLYKAPMPPPGTEEYEASAATRLEGRHINLSLHYLEQVVVALSTKKKGSPGTGHVPYRNSLLTTVLRDSLGGNCCTAFIATLNPEARHFEEAVATCRFASRVGQLSVEVGANEEQDLESQLKNLAREAHQLRQKLIRREAQQLTLLARIKDMETQVQDTAQQEHRNLSEEELQQCLRMIDAMLADDSSSEKALLSVQNSDRAVALACVRLLLDRCRAADLGRAANLNAIAEAQEKESRLQEELKNLQDTTSRKQSEFEEQLKKMQEDQEKRLQEALEAQAQEARSAKDVEEEEVKEDRRSPEFLTSLLTKGAIFIKHSNKHLSKPHTRFFWVSSSLSELRWRKAGVLGNFDSVPISNFEAAMICSPNFKTAKGRDIQDLFLTITLKKRAGDPLLLQLETGANENLEECTKIRDDWFAAFKFVIELAKRPLG